MTDTPLLSLLIPAVGGQGGGVLAEWIVDAALHEGYPVQGTSIPGVAQRTGSTTYYVELATDRDAEPPVFSLYPVPGALDVLVAPEFLEVGRMIELGFVAPSRTTVVCSTHRLYSIHEKIATGHAVYPARELEAAARASSRALIAFDALAVAREHGTEVNAVLLGALAGSGALPIGAEAYRAAIQRKGVGVAANLQGFEIGLGLARQAATGSPAEATPPAVIEPPAEFAADVAALPEALRPTVSVALARLVDYQDRAYAGRYLARLRPLVARARTPAGVELARLVARHLAVWMTYEDAIRVAQLKTRRARIMRIREEVRARDAEIVVTDYLKPDLDELYGILPYRLVAPFARWAERRWPHGRPTLGQHVRTTTVSGFLRVRLLTLLRPWRPVSYRAHEEHRRIDRWLEAVSRAAAWDEVLACEVARAAQLVKGYGDVRRRMAALFDGLLAGALRAAEREAAGGGGFAVARALAARYRELVLQGPDGEAQAPRLAEAALARLEAGDRPGALAALA
ncbi:MAG: indolepyruvate oxidoreductase subunit beta family protein [Candidatus Rokubacteria bacterium]|nr:indolepyruvate oxidoreductase subunit beta family protein [Candidatus Rokubacteria bacterium]